MSDIVMIFSVYETAFHIDLLLVSYQNTTQVQIFSRDIFGYQGILHMFVIFKSRKKLNLKYYGGDLLIIDFLSFKYKNIK